LIAAAASEASSMTKSRSLSFRLFLRSRHALRRYVVVLRVPGAAAFFGSALIARLGVAMTGLGLLLSVRHLTGSYAVAGVTSGVFATLEAVLGPQLARLVDRWGQAAVVVPAVLVHAAAITLTIAAARRAPIAVTLGFVALAGATVPQPGALSAARWSRLLDARGLRGAFSLEAMCNDLVFLAGPLAVVAASSMIGWWAGSAAAAGLLAIGCLALAAQRSTAPPASGRRRAAQSPRGAPVRLFTPPFLRILGINFALGCFFGAVPLMVTAAAQAAGVPSLAGGVLALSSASSMVGGAVYGSGRVRARPELVQSRATLVLAGGVLIAVAWPGLPGLTLMLMVGGATIAPLVATSSQLTHAHAATSHLTQGFVWINTASTAGIAVFGAVAGMLVSAFGDGRIAAIVLLGVVALAVTCAALSAHSAHVSDLYTDSDVRH
jgi:hypothetical protein